MIDYSVADGICLLTLNSPPVNTITFPLLDELRSSIDRACSDPDVQAIVITGTAEHFSAGADVGICDIDIESAQQTAADIEALGRKVMAMKTDVSSESDVGELISSFLNTFGKIDIL